VSWVIPGWRILRCLNDSDMEMALFDRYSLAVSVPYPLQEASLPAAKKMAVGTLYPGMYPEKQRFSTDKSSQTWTAVFYFFLVCKNF
jgi:hypothetical protein